MSNRKSNTHNLERRNFIRSGLTVAGALALPTAFVSKAFAAGRSPIGTYPAGSAGDSVFIGITVPRTGAYALQGEDELKGYMLAVKHINEGHPLIKKISPKSKKGVLGKKVTYGVADSGAKPNNAVQAQQRFISEDKAILMTGATSSAVAVALNKLAQREKVLYVSGISGSNDTTGKDCVRYGFRQCFYGQTAAAALGPVLVKTFGKNKKVAFMTPDYTYGHTVTKSFQDYLAQYGWTTATNQVSPLGSPDFSSYLLNVANSGADVLINVNWGHDAVLSIQQAKQFGILDKMKLVVTYQVPFLGRPIPAREDVRRGLRQGIRLQTAMGRRKCLHGIRLVGGSRGERRQLLSSGRDQVLRSRPQDQFARWRSVLACGRSPADQAGVSTDGHAGRRRGQRVRQGVANVDVGSGDLIAVGRILGRAGVRRRGDGRCVIDVDHAHRKALGG